MTWAGQVVLVDLGTPIGHEQGLRRPGVVITSDEYLGGDVIHVVPLTTTGPRLLSVEIDNTPQNGLTQTSYAEAHHLRAVSPDRVAEALGQIDPEQLWQIRTAVGLVCGID